MLIGGAALLAGWQLLGLSNALGPTWPPLTTILDTVGTQRNLLAGALGVTLTEAAPGFALGSLIGVSLAIVATVVLPLRKGVLRLAAIVNTFPLLVLGPLLFATVGRDTTPAALAAIVVVFTVFVATMSGLRSYQPAHADLFRALGARPAVILTRLQIPASLPGIVDSLKVAAPSALVGAIVGEWFGSERGVGVLLVSALQNYQTQLLWAAALLTAVVATGSYAGLSLLQRAVSGRFR